MSVSLSPSTSLGFNRPLTELVKRTLTITNQNAQPVAFKVKTTAPKLYSVRPNAGRVEPGESVGVSVQLQPMKEEPPPHVKCRDKFLVQSTTITPDKENMSLAEIWNLGEGDSDVKVHQQKIKVVYLPPEGQILEEEPEEVIHHTSHRTVTSEEGSRHYETVRQHPSGVNGHAPSYPVPVFDQSSHRSSAPDRSSSPHIDESFVAAREEQSRMEERQATRATPSPGPEPRQPSPMPVVNVNVHTPPAVQPPSPPDRSFVSSAPASTENDKVQENDLVMKLAEAQNEIQRLRALLAATPDPAEIRRRARALSSEETVVGEGDAASDAGTNFPEQSTSSRQDGASPQQVGIIALMVFIITYLFF